MAVVPEGATLAEAFDPSVPVFAAEGNLLAWPRTKAEEGEPTLQTVSMPERTGLLGWLDRWRTASQASPRKEIAETLSDLAPAWPEPTSSESASALASALPETEEPAESDSPAPEPAPTGAASAPRAPSPPPWSMIVLGAFAAGLILASGRLAIGVWAVERLRRASRPVHDPALFALRDQIAAELVVNRPVELREASGLGSPATIGWRGAVVLLPPEWCDWDDTQRRVVLAHELAHVARRDYPAWLLARLSVALHWYHPLAHWLAARLRLEQELAADAAAAPLAGGQEQYLATLAQLALTHDHAPAVWPARPLLTHAWTGTLLRRIEMLRTSKVRSGRAPTALRLAGYGALVGLGVLLAGVRGPGGPLSVEPLVRATEQQTDGIKPSAPATEPPGTLSLAHVPEDASLVIALRPSAILEQSEVRGILDAYAQVPELTRILALVDPGSIEQITLVMTGSDATFALKSNEMEALLGVNAGLIIHTKSPRDWLSLARGLAPLPVVEARRAGKVYHQVLIEEQIAIGLFQPDDRTVILALSHAMPMFLSPKRSAAEPSWAPAWKSIAGCDLAIAADVGSLIGPLLPLIQAGEVGGSPDLSEIGIAVGMVGPLWEETEQLVVGIELADKLGLKLIAVCANEAGARRVQRTLDALLTLADNTGRKLFPMVRRSALGIGGNGSDKEALLLLPLVDLGEQLLNEAKVTCEGRSVRFSTRSRFDLGSLMRLLLLAM
jgi:beta-lactamase regulating signal transducer with metallopeptidase domain